MQALLPQLANNGIKNQQELIWQFLVPINKLFYEFLGTQINVVTICSWIFMYTLSVSEYWCLMKRVFKWGYCDTLHLDTSSQHLYHSLVPSPPPQLSSLVARIMRLALLDSTTLYYGFTSLYNTLPWLYFALQHSTMVLYTLLYNTLQWLCLTLHDSTTLYNGSAWLYLTLLHSTRALLGCVIRTASDDSCGGGLGMRLPPSLTRCWWLWRLGHLPWVITGEIPIALLPLCLIVLIFRVRGNCTIVYSHQ